MAEPDYFSQEVAPDFYAEEISKKIPKTENFLQRAIKQTSGKPLFQGSDVPAIGHQFAEGVVGNAPQNVAQNPMTMAMSGFPGVQAKSGAQAIGGIKDLIFGGNSIPNENSSVEDNKYLTPQTIGGKVLGLGANIAGGLVNPANIALGGKVVNALRTGPIKNEIKGIEDLLSASKLNQTNIESDINKAKDALTQAKVSGASKAKETAYVGAKEIKGQVAGRFKDANQRFGEEFSKLDSTMADEDMAKIIKSAANDIGATDIPGSPGNSLKNQISKYGPKQKIGKDGLPIIQTKAKIYSKEKVQAITKEILDSLPDDRSKAIFHKHLLEGLSDTVPGLRELKASHAPIYKVAKESKFLKESNLRQIASGSAPESKVNDLSQYAERLGSSHVERAKKVADQNKLEQMMLDQGVSKAKKRLSANKQEQLYLESKTPELKRKLAATTGRKNWAIGTATAGIGLPTLGALYKKFFGGKD